MDNSICDGDTSNQKRIGVTIGGLFYPQSECGMKIILNTGKAITERYWELLKEYENDT
jgi:hypothetical protein